jgi:hypothetical protein
MGTLTRQGGRKLAPLALPLETAECCYCLTVASTLLTRRLVWRRRFSAERRASLFWRPVASRSGYPANGCTASDRSAARSPSSTLTAAKAATFPAVQLFVERVTAIVENFALTDANASLIVAICRRLDGLPLAIEFAAPRVETLGIEGLAAGLYDSLRLLGAQRRAAMPRHRTMQAVVDWSYGLLSENEQRFLRARAYSRAASPARRLRQLPWMRQYRALM